LSKKSGREVSRRVVSRRVVGSANPVAKWGRDSKSTCMDSIGGFFFGVLLFLVTFSLPFCAARTEKDSKQVKMDVTPAAAVAEVEGIATVQGNLSASPALAPPVGEPDQPILAYDYLVERYEYWEETHEETRTEIEGGKEVEYTEEVTTEHEGYREYQHEKKWGNVKLGGISIDPNKCKIDLPWVEILKEEYLNEATMDQMRQTVKVIYAAADVYLYGEFAGGQIVDKPDFYRLSTRPPEAEAEQMHKEEESGRWFKIIAAIILWTISFNLMLGPAMVLINIFPVKAIGAGMRFVLTLVSLVLACIITLVTYTFFRYWWVFVLLMVGLAVWVIISANQKRQAEPDDVELDLDPEPEDTP